jgi:hypothetical protein
LRVCREDEETGESVEKTRRLESLWRRRGDLRVCREGEETGESVEKTRKLESL